MNLNPKDSMVELIDKENVPRYIFIEMNLSLGHNLKTLLSYEKNIFFKTLDKLLLFLPGQIQLGASSLFSRKPISILKATN